MRSRPLRVIGLMLVTFNTAVLSGVVARGPQPDALTGLIGTILGLVVGCILYTNGGRE